MTAWWENKLNKINTCNQAVSKDAWLFFYVKKRSPEISFGRAFLFKEILFSFYINNLTVSREIACVLIADSISSFSTQRINSASS